MAFMDEIRKRAFGVEESKPENTFMEGAEDWFGGIFGDTTDDSYVDPALYGTPNPMTLEEQSMFPAHLGTLPSGNYYNPGEAFELGMSAVDPTLTNYTGAQYPTHLNAQNKIPYTPKTSHQQRIVNQAKVNVINDEIRQDPNHPLAVKGGKGKNQKARAQLQKRANQLTDMGVAQEVVLGGKARNPHGRTNAQQREGEKNESNFFDWVNSATSGLFGTKKDTAGEAQQNVYGDMATRLGVDPKSMQVLVKLESGNTGYTARNPSSSAYGKYQFMTGGKEGAEGGTGLAYARKLGYEGNEGKDLRSWMTPERQDQMFEEFTRDNLASLKANRLPQDTFHLYGAHQQGMKGFKEILSATRDGKLSDIRASKIKNNLPKGALHNLKGKALADAWVKYYKNKTQ